MSRMAELDMLSYDIEQLWIEGKNPVEIAGEIDCHIDLVHAWIDLNNLKDADSAISYYHC
jgi:hypothetical protein